MLIRPRRSMLVPVVERCRGWRPCSSSTPARSGNSPATSRARRLARHVDAIDGHWTREAISAVSGRSSAARQARAGRAESASGRRARSPAARPASRQRRGDERASVLGGPLLRCRRTSTAGIEGSGVAGRTAGIGTPATAGAQTAVNGRIRATETELRPPSQRRGGVAASIPGLRKPGTRARASSLGGRADIKDRSRSP